MEKIAEIAMWASRTIPRVALVIWWFFAVPSVFVLLYTSLELQRASRSAFPDQPTLANYRILGLANDIKSLQVRVRAETVQLQKTWDEYNQQKRIFDADRSLARQAILDYAAAHKINIDPKTCSADWPDVSNCYDQFRIEVGKRGQFGAPGVANVSGAIEKAKMEVMRYNDDSRLHNDSRDYLAKYQQQYMQLLSGKDIDGTAGGGALAFTFDRMREYLTVMPYIFVLPAGVIVAFFTAIMGGIGAAIASLSKELDPSAPTTTVEKAYVFRPLIGTLAGFIVFFVVSAGAAFLVQPSGADATSAVNSLSPPALASLGVFAGLSSEQAVRWLKDKADQFFK